MDRCHLCGREIQHGVQYIVSLRQISYGSKPWFATDGKHYAFCAECDKALRLYLRWAKNAQKD